MLGGLASSAEAGRVFKADFLSYPNGPGTWGWYSAAADLNGDGRDELLTLSGLGPVYLNVRAGQSGGVLSSSLTTLPVGLDGADFSGYIEPEDVDGDGLVDVVVTGLDSLFIFRNLGGGMLAAPVRLYVPGLSDDPIAVGDLNGDTKPDLAVVLAFSNRVQIFLGAGGLAFTPGPTFATLSNPSAVEITDVDENSIPDVIVSADTTSLLLTGLGGGGTFGAPIPHGVSAPWLAADFNGDGAPDLVGVPPVTSFNRWVSVARGAGNGSFAAPDSFVRYNGAYTICSGDFDGDGHLDLGLCSYDVGVTFVMPGRGNGEFERAIHIPLPVGPTRVAVGNLGGDPHLDIIAAVPGNRTLSVLLSQNAAAYGSQRPIRRGAACGCSRPRTSTATSATTSSRSPTARWSRSG